jgi:uncharacterized oligopeptide transporter (OPT) family protein
MRTQPPWRRVAPDSRRDLGFDRRRPLPVWWRRACLQVMSRAIFGWAAKWRRNGFRLLLSARPVGGRAPVGLWVGVAMLVGALTLGLGCRITGPAGGADSIVHLAQATWSHKVRTVGAGTIAVATVWTLAS